MNVTLRLLLAALLLAAATAHAARKPAARDVIWTHPDPGARPLRSIALLPAVAYDNDLAEEKIVEAVAGQTLRGVPYRWLGPELAKERLRNAFGGDSVLRALDAMVLRGARVDSLAAPALSAALRTDALLVLRMDLFDQVQMEFNQAGKPSTTVQLKAALVDSMGRLLWTAAGSETAEGTWHDPQAGAIGVRSSGLNPAPMTGQAGAPALDHVASVLLRRWAERFPRPAAAPGAAAPARTDTTTPR